MTARLAAWLWLLLAVWLGPVQASGEASPADAAADLRAGRAFVAVVIDQADKRLVASEAYADWHSYYRRFATKGRGSLPLHTLSPARARAQLPMLGRQLRNGTLFVDAQGQGLLHEGLVLEPQVYVMGRAFAETGAVPAQASDYGLKSIALKR